MREQAVISNLFECQSRAQLKRPLPPPVRAHGAPVARSKSCLSFLTGRHSSKFISRASDSSETERK